MNGYSKWVPPAALLLVLWVARHSLSPFVVGAVLAYIVGPLVDNVAARTGWPRVWAALLVALATVATAGVGVWLLGARLVTEARSLGGDIPTIVDAAVQSVTGGSTIDVLGQRVTPEDLSARIQVGVAGAIGSPSDVVHAARVALELSLKIFLVLLVFVYLLVDSGRVGAFLLRFVPPDHRGHAETMADEMHRLLGRYLQGQLLLVALVSVVVFVALEFVFRVRYALPIAVATGFLEVIPFLGPIAAGVLASGVALTQHGPAAAGWMALFYLVLRQAEDQLVMPIVVGRAVHVHPLATIFAVVVGEQVAGVLGMLLAVPMAAACKVILDYAYPPAMVEREHSQSRRARLRQAPLVAPGAAVVAPVDAVDAVAPAAQEAPAEVSGPGRHSA